MQARCVRHGSVDLDCNLVHQPLHRHAGPKQVGYTVDEIDGLAARVPAYRIQHPSPTLVPKAGSRRYGTHSQPAYEVRVLAGEQTWITRSWTAAIVHRGGVRLGRSD